MNEQKAKCEATEKRESERRQVEEKKHNEEIQFLKRTNQQLKVIITQAQVEVLPHLSSQPHRPSIWFLFFRMTVTTCPHALPRSKGGWLLGSVGERWFRFITQILHPSGSGGDSSSTLNPHDTLALLSSGGYFSLGIKLTILGRDG